MYNQHVHSTTCAGPACAFLGHFDAPELALAILCFRIFSSIFFNYVVPKILFKKIIKIECQRVLVFPKVTILMSIEDRT